jgi:serine/threonine-protein kinase
LGETTSPLTASGEGLGTAGFSAPEVYDVDAHQVDERADVYSVGRIAAWLVTGRWPRPNHPLTPEGELRGWVLECTDLAPDRRPGSITEALERLKELTSEPTTSSRGAIQEILERTPLPLEDAADALRLALRHPDDTDIWIDEIARMPLETVRSLARTDPGLAVESAEMVLRHTEWSVWGHRDFNYANTPLRWVHEVLTVILRDGHEGLAEDLATKSFEREMDMDRWTQQGVTVRWMRTLEEPEGRIIRRAIMRSRTRDYYAAVAEARILSRTLAAEFGR